jgi:tetratricopeptide (TPR) repeat protein
MRVSWLKNVVILMKPFPFTLCKLLSCTEGDAQQAINLYTQALQIDPDYSLAYLNRGAAYNNLGNFTGAIADF